MDAGRRDPGNRDQAAGSTGSRAAIATMSVPIVRRQPPQRVPAPQLSPTSSTVIAPQVMALLREQGLDDVLVLIGGIIPDVDVPKLKDIGVKGIFLPGTPMQEIIDFITSNARTRTSENVIGGCSTVVLDSADSTKVAHTLLLADDSVTIQRVIELTFADEDIRVVRVILRGVEDGRRSAHGVPQPRRIDRYFVTCAERSVALALERWTRIDQCEVDVEKDCGDGSACHARGPSNGPATTTAALSGSSARRAASCTCSRVTARRRAGMRAS